MMNKTTQLSLWKVHKVQQQGQIELSLNLI